MSGTVDPLIVVGSRVTHGAGGNKGVITAIDNRDPMNPKYTIQYDDGPIKTGYKNNTRLDKSSSSAAAPGGAFAKPFGKSFPSSTSPGGAKQASSSASGSNGPSWRVKKPSDEGGGGGAFAKPFGKYTPLGSSSSAASAPARSASDINLNALANEFVAESASKSAAFASGDINQFALNPVLASRIMEIDASLTEDQVSEVIEELLKIFKNSKEITDEQIEYVITTVMMDDDELHYLYNESKSRNSR